MQGLAAESTVCFMYTDTGSWRWSAIYEARPGRNEEKIGKGKGPFSVLLKSAYMVVDYNCLWLVHTCSYEARCISTDL